MKKVFQLTFALLTAFGCLSINAMPKKKGGRAKAPSATGAAAPPATTPSRWPLPHPAPTIPAPLPDFVIAHVKDNTPHSEIDPTLSLALAERDRRISAAHLAQLTADNAIDGVPNDFVAAVARLKIHHEGKGAEAAAINTPPWGSPPRSPNRAAIPLPEIPMASILRLINGKETTDDQPAIVNALAARDQRVSTVHLSQLTSAEHIQGVPDEFRARLRKLKMYFEKKGAKAAAQVALIQLQDLTIESPGAPKGLRERVLEILKDQEEALARTHETHTLSGPARANIAAAHMKQLTADGNVDGVSDEFRRTLTANREAIAAAVAQAHLEQLTAQGEVEGVNDEFREALAELIIQHETAIRIDAARRARRGYVLSALGGGAVVGLSVAAYQNGSGTLFNWMSNIRAAR